MTCVKICGITRTEDALLAAEAGADFLGFVFHRPSPRYVTPEQVGEIVRSVSRSHIVCCVGVFVDEALDTVRSIVAGCGLDYAQLHGTEPPEMVASLMDGGVKVIKALRVRDGTSLGEIARYRATAYLLDTYVPGEPGGTGHTFDWTLAAQAVGCGPVILAGGLTPDNVARAIRTAQPWCVDVASGVEAAPGRKDAEKVRRFIAAVKGDRSRTKPHSHR